MNIQTLVSVVNLFHKIKNYIINNYISMDTESLILIYWKNLSIRLLTIQTFAETHNYIQYEKKKLDYQVNLHIYAKNVKKK